MIGKNILHYYIIEKLGEGGMGVVYLAEDTKLKRQVAIKFLPQNISRNSDERKRFEIEAQAAAALNHPNIATIYAIEHTDDDVFIVMEYIEGKELKHITVEAKGERPKAKEALPMANDQLQTANSLLPTEYCIDIASQIASGLQAAHDKGIIHRDIKSSNIMITDKGQVKIMDFGLAKVGKGIQLTKEQSTLGTAPYMSPEQIRGEDVDHRSDIWSFGIVLYEMLTGKLPFNGDYEQAVIYSILNEEPESFEKNTITAPPELQQIVKRGLQKDRRSRYLSSTELLEALQGYQGRLGSLGSGVLNLRTILSKIRRPRIALPAVAAIFFTILSAAWFFKHQEKIRWAREVALPEIEQLVASPLGDFTDAYKLAEEAEKYIPNNSKLAELLSKSSLKININTEPPGADIYMKIYKSPGDEWVHMGISPIENVRVPIGVFRWKLEKEGFETVQATAATWDADYTRRDYLIPNDLARVLDEKGSLPPEMARVPGTKTPLGMLDDFFIDRYEVTNKQYKAFIDSGGYKNKDYWQHKFVLDGSELTWENAIAKFIDQTGRTGPAKWQAGDFPAGEENYPVSGISWFEAAAYAVFAGKSLPTEQHWGAARGEFTPLLKHPYLGGLAVFAPFSNYENDGPVQVGSLGGITSYGAYDMAGNVREWCWNETPVGRLVRGGGWGDVPYSFEQLSSAPPFERSAKIGFRCVVYPDPEKVSESVLTMTTFGKTKDFYNEKPVSNAIFKVYKEQFSYDKTDLNPIVESKDESHTDWTTERITFDAAYRNERIIAHLFLPKKIPPPYQTIIYVPGGGALDQLSSEDITNYSEFQSFLSFLIKNGRAVLYPVYQSTFERQTPALYTVKHTSHWYTDYVIQIVKDFKRSIDYLETRPEIDCENLAYYGLSWGGRRAAIIPAVEERLKTSIVLAGGLLGKGRPEVNQMSYITRVKIPTLMLNGKYDSVFPYETSVKPMFDLLGTPDAQKLLKVYKTDHIPPRNEYIKEILAWLDLYLGPVE